MTAVTKSATPWRAALIAAGCALTSACAGGTSTEGITDLNPGPTAGSPAAAGEAVVVSEAWVSAGDTLWDVDTPALWSHGARSILVTTAKATHDLKLFDGRDGSSLGSLGSEGDGLGEFRRPNGVIVVGSYALVVERDNRRVQVLLMPDGTPLGTFGANVLEYPYGLAAAGDPTSLTVWVTDDYEYEEDVVPWDLTRRVHRFEVKLVADGPPQVVGHESFGAPHGEGSLRVVESIQVDPDHDLLYIADESRRSYLEYDGAGRYRERALGQGFIEGDPEGIMLVRCGPRDGYWIVTDQQEDVSLFRVFERRSLDYRGTFRGRVTANTDGATFEPGPVPGFPRGVVYTVHDDRATSAFDWGVVSEALELEPECVPERGPSDR